VASVFASVIHSMYSRLRLGLQPSNVALALFPFADGWVGSHVTNAGALLDHYGVASANVAPDPRSAARE
jgi:hypothetical protein